jgi:hypothetical protein
VNKSTHFHDKEDDEDDDSSDEGEQAEEKTFAGPLAIDAPVAFGAVRVQRVVDVVRYGGELLVQPTLEDAVLLELTHRAPHDVGDGGSDQAEMKFQFKSKKKIITGVARQHSSQTSHIESFRNHSVDFRFEFDITNSSKWFRMNQQAI